MMGSFLHDMLQTVAVNMLLLLFFCMVAIGVFIYQRNKQRSRRAKRSITLRYNQKRFMKLLGAK